MQKALRSLETGRFGLRLRRQGAGATSDARDSRSSARAQRSRTPSASSGCSPPSAPGWTLEEIYELTDDRPLVPPPPQADRRRGGSDLGRGRRPSISAAPRSSASPTARSPTLTGADRGRRPRRAQGSRRSSPPTGSSTPAPPSSRPTRPTSTRPTATRTRPARRDKKKIIILGGGPNRIGQGIEFDYCCVHAAFAAQGARLRDHHGELEPGDRLHRLRHLRQALLRAAHARGRAQHLRAGKTATASSSSSAARPRSTSPPTSNATASPSSAPRPKSSNWPRTASSSPPCSTSSASSRPKPAPPPPRTRRSPSPTASATRCSSARPSCSAAAR